MTDLDLSQIIDESKSLLDGAILVPGYTADGWAVRLYAESGLYPADQPISTFTPAQREDFLNHAGQKIKIGGINMSYEGLLVRLQKSVFSKEPASLQPHLRAFVERAVTFVACPTCAGTRLARHTLGSAVMVAQVDELPAPPEWGLEVDLPAAPDGQVAWNIAAVSELEIKHLPTWCKALAQTPAGQQVAPALRALEALTQSFVDLGIGYLSLARPSGTLSGGESQRVKLLKHFGSALTDVTYIFDEPSTGMHPADISRMNQVLTRLRDKGNTVLVVEHKPQVIEMADWVVDLGPGGGSEGGQVIFTGTPAALVDCGTLTGQHLGEYLQR